MPRDFFPRREADILGWTSNFRAKIVSGGSAFGVSPSQIDAYVQVQGRFAVVYAAAHSPTERTPSVMSAKQTARIALEAQSRMLAGLIGAQPNTTREMRITLGLALRKRGGYRRAIPPPGEAPRLRVRSIDGRFATLVFIDREGDKRRKPRGAFGAIVWSFVGEVPPADIREWKYAGQTTRTISRMAFDARLAPGTKVWVTACWRNSRGKEGRPCDPVMLHVGGGGPMMQSPRSSRMLYVLAIREGGVNLLREASRTCDRRNCRTAAGWRRVILDVAPRRRPHSLELFQRLSGDGGEGS